jgi:hypothetical protein
MEFIGGIKTKIIDLRNFCSSDQDSFWIVFKYPSNLSIINRNLDRLRITGRGLDVYVKADVLTNGIMKQLVSYV